MEKSTSEYLKELKQIVLQRTSKADKVFEELSVEVLSLLANKRNRNDDIREGLMEFNKSHDNILTLSEVHELYLLCCGAKSKNYYNLRISQQPVDISMGDTSSLTATQSATVSKLQKSTTGEVSVEEVLVTYTQVEKELLKKLGSYDFNDSGNAKRFVENYKDKVKFNSTMEKWLVWNGKYWEIDTKLRILSFAQKVAKQIFASASIEKDNAKSTGLAKWAITSNNRKRIDDMLYLAQTGLAVTEDELDQNNYLFNLANGTYDLEHDIFLDHKPEDNLTKISTNVSYEPDAKCPEWLKFLEFIFESKQNIINFIQRAIGYSLCGDTSGQCFFFAYGTGKNGKTAMFNVLKMLFGDYYQKTHAELLLQKKLVKGIPNDLARLKGARFVVASELPEGRYMNEEVIKDLTGSDRIAARFLYKEWFEFEPTHKLWIYGNHKPIIRGQDPAIWRRPKLIPFNLKIPVEREIPMETLLKIMKKELSGIFNWTLQGYRDYKAAGLQPPAEIESAVDEYRQEMDIVEGFVDECLVETVGEKVKVSVCPAPDSWSN